MDDNRCFLGRFALGTRVRVWFPTVDRTGVFRAHVDDQTTPVPSGVVGIVRPGDNFTTSGSAKCVIVPDGPFSHTLIEEGCSACFLTELEYLLALVMES